MASIIQLLKRQFTIDLGAEKISVEGQVHRNVALKYLMKRRRSLLSTKDPEKVDDLFLKLPKRISIMGKVITRAYKVIWQKEGTEEFVGSRFVFKLEDELIIHS
jgi:hypothetical protein